MERKKLSRFFILILFLAAFFAWQAIFAQITLSFPLIKVTFFDVGEGDSILISTPSFKDKFGNRIQILIDGGPRYDVVEKITGEMPLFDRKIELLILTHPDKDHISGLFEVVETLKVDKVLMPKLRGKYKEKELYVNFKDLLEEKDIEIIWAREGQRISFPRGSSLLIFWPEENFESKNTNDFSIISKLSFGDIDFLFTGDAPKKVEYQLLTKNYNLESEVLKVAHHGSYYSTSEYFLEKVSPEVAVISVGENKYGHPASEVLDLISKYDIKLFRTDESGDIKIISDGKNYQIMK